MKTLIRLSMIFGMLLLLLTAMLLLVRREKPIQWMIYGVWDVAYIMNFETGESYQIDEMPNGYLWWPTDDGFLVMAQEENGLSRLFSLRPNGRQVEALDYTTLYGVTNISWDSSSSHYYFQVYQDAQYADIYRVRKDGHNLENLTNTSTTHEGWLKVSPDGKWIIFESGEVYKMRPDGSQRQRFGAYGSLFVEWLPDDDAVLLIQPSGIADPTQKLVRQPLDGTEYQTLVTFKYIRGVQFWPGNGEWLIFDAIEHDRYDIYRVRLDGSMLQNLTNSPNYNDRLRSISPDGQWIVLQSMLGDTGDIALLRLNIDEMQIETVLPNSSNTDFKVWSPDGHAMIVQSDLGLFACDLLGNVPIQLSRNESDIRVETWSPDGEWLVYTATETDQFGENDLFRVRVDGSGRQRITNHWTWTTFDAWLPIIDLPLNPTPLITLSTILIGGGLCVEYLSSQRSSAA